MALKPFSIPPKNKLALISFHNNKFGMGKIFKYIKNKQQHLGKNFKN